MNSYEFYDRQCEHDKNSTWKIIDFQNGTEVCTRCGKVTLSEIFSCYNNINGGSYPSITNAFSNLKIEEEEKTQFSYNLMSASELCKDVLNSFHVSQDLIDLTCKKLHQLKDKLKPGNIDQISAICFENACIEQNVQRTKNEICQMFKISPKSLQTKKGKIDLNKNQIDTIKPSQIFPRLQFPFKVPYKIEMYIKNKADEIYGKVNATPNAVIGYVMYTYMLEKDNELVKKKMSMNEVSKFCMISSTSIKRLCKMHKKK